MIEEKKGASAIRLVRDEALASVFGTGNIDKHHVFSCIFESVSLSGRPNSSNPL